jgi:heptosyltransferase-2
MRDFAAYLLYRASSAVIAALPLSVVFRIGQLTGSLAWLLFPGYRRLALRNAAIALPDKSSVELRRIVRRHFQLLGANLLSSVKIGTMPPEEIEKRVEIHNSDAMGRQFRAGVPVVLLLGHFSNWELFSQLMPKCFPSIRASSVYQRLSNRLIDAHVRRNRSRTGLELFDRSAGFQPVIDLLRSGGGVGILSDQHAGDNGIWTPFFGKLASTSPLPALLAKRTGAAVLAAAVYTEGVARWRMVFTECIETSGASIEVLTGRVNALIEQQILVAPEDWFWVHDRWKTPRPNFLLAKYKRGVYLPPTMSADQLKPFRVLIRSSNWLGDAVMSVPAVRAIKRGRPDAHVSVIVSEDLAPVWKLIPEVDEIITANTASIVSVVRAIRSTQVFDVAVLFPNSLRTAMEAWLGGIPRRVGYRGHRRAWLLNQVVRERGKPQPPEHQARRYLRIAQALGAEIDDSSVGGAVGVPWDANSLPYQAGTPAVMRLGLCPGAEYGPAKRWLPERFAEAAAAVAAQSPVTWVLLGKAADGHIGETITRSLGDRCLNRIGQTTLQELIDELRTCRLLLTNDTGTMHLAALLGVPTVAIFGSTEPRLTSPLGTNHAILRHHVECSPCFLRNCPIDFRCMKSVTVDEVVNSVLSMLGDRGSHDRHGD